MPDYLTEKDWKAQLKQHKEVRDTGISEPLREYEKNCEKDFAKAIVALKKLATKVEAAKKDYKKNADFCKYLRSMASEAQDEQETLEKKLKGEEVEEGPDKELNKALKRAKTDQMFFAVIAKSATAGKLLMGRAKIPGSAIADAKQEIGGGHLLRGLCIGEDGTHVFYFRDDPPTTMPQLLKSLAKQDAGLTIHVECRRKADLQDTGEVEDKKAKTGKAPGSAPSGSAQVKPRANGPSVDPAQIKACEAANAKWTQAKAAADTSMRALRTALWKSNDQQALAVAKGLGRVLSELPDLGASLARMISAGKQGQPEALQNAAAETRNAISACVAYLSKNPLVADVEANPFVKVDLKKSLGTVLAETTKSCKL
jgi:hypothetical protein